MMDSKGARRGDYTLSGVRPVVAFRRRARGAQQTVVRCGFSSRISSTTKRRPICATAQYHTPKHEACRSMPKHTEGYRRMISLGPVPLLRPQNSKVATRRTRHTTMPPYRVAGTGTAERSVFCSSPTYDTRYPTNLNTFTPPTLMSCHRITHATRITHVVVVGNFQL